MSMFRVPKHDNYTVMSNCHLRDKRLSLKAKGLLSYMLSCSDDWDFSVAGLYKTHKEGKDSIRTGLDELEKYGYLVREQTRNANGSFGRTEYIVYEEPHLNTKSLSTPSHEIPAPNVPETDIPHTENPTQRNTKPTKTKVKNNFLEENNLSTEAIYTDVKEQISYETLIENADTKLIDNLTRIITELYVFAYTYDSVSVGQEEYPSKLIIDKLKRIGMPHIQYILECFNKHNEKVHNIKAYLQKSILNAPDTIDAYYDAEVRNDMKHWKRQG